MTVTNKGMKCRQLLTGESCKEGSPQKNSAEHEGYAGVHSSLRITENNISNANLSKGNLLEEILDRDNMNKAFKKIKSNKGSHGIDGMGVDELLQYLKENGDHLRQRVLDGKYRPNPVRRVEIPKEDGKKRKLGIPTVVDRVIQQAIAQVLSPIYEEQFSDNSYGFRPGRSTHDAIKKSQQNINEGYKYVVDMDLEKYFDTVNQSKLIEVLSKTIKDGRVISLINKYLRAGVMIKHTYKDTEVGVPQGGPLSPILSNIMLHELDKELEKRGHEFVRYADDLLIFCKSRRSAGRTLKNILPFIENKLFLKVNKDKTVVAYVGKVRFLGFGFYRHKGKARLRVHLKSVTKMRTRIKELTSRSYGISNEARAKKLSRYIMGWVNYFKPADMKNLLINTDSWMRRRIRMIYWKQWKKVRTKFKMLKFFGANKYKAWEYANTRKGYWRISNSPVLSKSLGNDVIKGFGFLFFSEYYRQVKA
ncbi:group II intron reverse transcriptase/maturase [Natranaerobius thermophilus]|uniref:RNA-directed DNA polymerase n=1 Tax=Natranaerobius thermophilus (strain ATCC BAA-1301 / DSM 18059 / JW/NM-WN-LF) TaxID=457570 RepID=B2A0J9_NATTJ|nr:group II intron reverse transcriptase/maturase [Natranaerobius thermophilus]ACB83741.1 RNA-directed DNA polymerase (Reverse transcriptase) [Natranaerobius thermophilus JW/NM-WN-LF]ACB84179.1 RNA-directed DNA polymerase (Reverse transcriptase) [Natranaerobius thermophilus JW/NM-WN-LF]ACB84219.1 RNA-directed DNA polymerase (Reverse transcriptase) [Natranaerobius thermophilus JW/NM-WN-LF]ACB84398.1 RNA-directed DNA polymerase (Reverse transcriptase) [Natranaerobius thermophilus JW/NM-WN-LF]ACB